MLSLRTMVDHAAARKIDATNGYEVAGESCVAELKDGRLRIRRGNTAGADVIFRAPEAAAIAGLLYAKLPLEALEADAGLTVEGDRELAKRYAALFELPEKIGRP